MKRFTSYKMRLINKNSIHTTFLYILIISLVSCKKLIEVASPVTNTDAGNVYTSDATAASVLTNIYAEMSAQNIRNTSVNLSNFSWYGGLSADELTLFNKNFFNYNSYYSNDLISSINSSGTTFWEGTYPVIFVANSAIEGITSAQDLTPIVKNHLLGEAKFVRAFCYFYLVNMYGDLPLILSTNWKINASVTRSPTKQIYEQIITDLKESQNLLSDSYLKGDVLTSYPIGFEERVRPNRLAATALLARVYLYIKDWANAEIQATTVINNSKLYTLESLDNTFKKNNKEAIWQLQPVFTGTGANSGDGRLFILPSGGPNSNRNPVYLSSTVVSAFELGDLRKKNWIDSVKSSGVVYYYPKKYKIGNVNAATQEYTTVLRLAEQYLIRAEARAQQDNIIGAKIDLNVIRSRANILDFVSNDKTDVLNAIMHERQVELFTEWGHRWFDLKRTESINYVMSSVTPIKSNGQPWRSFQALYPIPQSDIDKNPNLVQNPEY